MKFKIRCSAIHRIMAASVGASESQLAFIKDMDAREKPMTAKMKEKYDAAVLASENPEPTAGMKTYCEEWLRAKLYNRTKEVKSKFIDKGHACEDISIDFLNTFELTDYAKNEVYFQNDFLTGTPDIAADRIIDMKNSWDVHTFPLFDDEPKKDYMYQVNGYMHLTGLTKSPAWVVHCLMDAPHDIIVSDAKSKAYRKGGTWEDYFEASKKELTFPDIPDDMKIKKFEVEYNADIMAECEYRVQMCQEYINKLLRVLNKEK